MVKRGAGSRSMADLAGADGEHVRLAGEGGGQSLGRGIASLRVPFLSSRALPNAGIMARVLFQQFVCLYSR